MPDSETWYIVKQPEGHCEIVPANSIETSNSPDPGKPDPGKPDPGKPDESRWGPYASQPEAIARRVGLIRAGKCQPI